MNSAIGGPWAREVVCGRKLAGCSRLHDATGDKVAKATSPSHRRLRCAALCCSALLCLYAASTVVLHGALIQSTHSTESLDSTTYRPSPHRIRIPTARLPAQYSAPVLYTWICASPQKNHPPGAWLGDKPFLFSVGSPHLLPQSSLSVSSSSFGECLGAVEGCKFLAFSRLASSWPVCAQLSDRGTEAPHIMCKCYHPSGLTEQRSADRKSL
jgi:hypothetical protein